jgi:hypothetical protein
MENKERESSASAAAWASRPRPLKWRLAVKPTVKMLLFASLVAWTLWGYSAPAQDSTPKAEKAAEKGSAKGGKKKETSINFEDELVEGELKKPELFYLLQKKQFNFKRLIKLREDFLPEMRRDADEIRRSRSKN